MANEFDKEKVPTPISMIVSFLLCDLFVHSFDFVIVETASTTDQQFFFLHSVSVSLSVCVLFDFLLNDFADLVYFMRRKPPLLP